MAHLKNMTTGEIITPYVTLEVSQELTVTVQTALDGTEYLTRFGKPVYNYELELYLRRSERTDLMDAFDCLDPLEVSVRDGVYHGRLKSLGHFEQITHNWYKVTAVLSSTGEVSDP